LFSEEDEMKLRNGGLVEVYIDVYGFIGDWFCARVVTKQGERFLVEYRDLVSNEDERKQLRHKLNNCHTRTSPPKKSKYQFNLYDEFDAYENDGWWVGD
jgi:hypothetical protein